MTVWECGKNVLVRTSVPEDVGALKDCLRACDVAEIWASNRHTPEASLVTGLNRSAVCLTILHKTTPVAMFGIVPTSDGRGCIWLLGTDGLKNIKTSFLKFSKKFINLLFHKEFTAVFNYVDERNVASIEWLKWCGAQFQEAKPYGIDGKKFKYFEIRR